MDWIAKIPADWQTMHMKRLFSFCKGLSITKADLVETGLPVISYGQIHAKNNTGTRIEDHLLRYVPEICVNGNISSKVTKGDFIFADTSEDLTGCGNCAYIDRDGIYAGYHSVIAKSDKENNKYFAYLFLSDEWRKQLRTMVGGIKVFSITQSILGRAFVIIPPIEEQERIAAYLDEKCSAIDDQVALLDKKLKAYERLKTSIINNAVTHGLNPDVEMRPSDIEWIGDIPAHWCVKRIKDLVDINNETLKDDTPLDYTFKYIDIGNVTSDGVITLSEDMTFYDAPSRARRIIHKGDVIVSTVRTYLKAIAPIDFDASNIIASTGFAVLTPLAIESSFLMYLMRNSTVIDQICSQSTGVSYPAISSSKISSISVVIPPIDEQRAIATYLDEKCGEIDTAIENIGKQIDAYKRLKRSLIDEVVTGKRAV